MLKNPQNSVSGVYQKFFFYRDFWNRTQCICQNLKFSQVLPMDKSDAPNTAIYGGEQAFQNFAKIQE